MLQEERVKYTKTTEGSASRYNGVLFAWTSGETIAGLSGETAVPVLLAAGTDFDVLPEGR